MSPCGPRSRRSPWNAPLLLLPWLESVSSGAIPPSARRGFNHRQINHPVRQQAKIPRPAAPVYRATGQGFYAGPCPVIRLAKPVGLGAPDADRPSALFNRTPARVATRAGLSMGGRYDTSRQHKPAAAYHPKRESGAITKIRLDRLLVLHLYDHLYLDRHISGQGGHARCGTGVAAPFPVHADQQV